MQRNPWEVAFLRHEDYMRRAMKLAAKAAEAGDVPVGALIVCDGEVIAESGNAREQLNSATAHAEVLAIEAACKKLGRRRLSGCTLYVTLEPCPMCAGAIINARIKRVVFGASDPKAGSCGSVVNLFDKPYNHKPEVVSGVLEAECAQILTDFFRTLRAKRAR